MSFLSLPALPVTSSSPPAYLPQGAQIKVSHKEAHCIYNTHLVPYQCSFLFAGALRRGTASTKSLYLSENVL